MPADQAMLIRRLTARAECRQGGRLTIEYRPHDQDWRIHFANGQGHRFDRKPWHHGGPFDSSESFMAMIGWWDVDTTTADLTAGLLDIEARTRPGCQSLDELVYAKVSALRDLFGWMANHAAWPPLLPFSTSWFAMAVSHLSGLARKHDLRLPGYRAARGWTYGVETDLSRVTIPREWNAIRAYRGMAGGMLVVNERLPGHRYLPNRVMDEIMAMPPRLDPATAPEAVLV
jgi:hypothetical protein